jgi:hypothetical protein
MRDIKGFEGLYSITSDGKVWSHSTGRFKKAYSTNYEYTDLYKDNIRHKASVHRLVAQAFIENHNNLPEVDHKDNNPFNNDYTNLQWITRKGNLERSYATMSPVRNFKGCELHRGKELLGKFKSIKECCRYCVALGLSFSTMEKYRKCGEYTITM